MVMADNPPDKMRNTLHAGARSVQLTGQIQGDSAQYAKNSYQR